jgi:hypothetical protein
MIGQAAVVAQRPSTGIARAISASSGRPAGSKPKASAAVAKREAQKASKTNEGA